MFATAIVLASCASPSDMSRRPAASSIASSEATSPAPAPTGGAAQSENAASEHPLPQVVTGYGDFSGVSFHDMDWALWAQRVVECLNDHGFAAEVIAGPGIGYQQIPVDQNQAMQAMQKACEAGMNVPKAEPRSREQLAEIYAYRVVALRDCLLGEGYDIPEPPTFETWLETRSDPEDHYNVWRHVPDAGNIGGSWDHVTVRCPSLPAGGYGAWEPGDPVRPLQAPPESED